MTTDNRNKHSSASKTAHSVLETNRGQEFENSSTQTGVALNSARDTTGSHKPKRAKIKPGLWDKMDAVLDTAEDLGIDIRCAAWGKFSASLTFITGEGHSDHVSIACAGEQYWIRLIEDSARFPIRWSNATQ